MKVTPIISNYNANVSYGRSAVQKAVSAPVIKQNTKKAASLGAMIMGFFTAKNIQNAKTDDNQIKKSKLKTEYREEKIYDKNGNLTNILKYSKADDVLSINVAYDVESGKILQRDYYKKDGTTKQLTEVYDKEGKKSSLCSYYKNGYNVEWIEQYGKNDTFPSEVTWFDHGGNITEQIYLNEHDGSVNNRFRFDENGNLTERVEMHNLTNKPFRTTKYDSNGAKTVKEYDVLSGKETGNFKYDENNRLIDFNVEDDLYDKKSEYFQYKKILQNLKEKDEDSQEPQSVYTKQDMDNINKFLNNRFDMEHSE